MKAIILAGGSGDRLWPLSRKDYPKQFLNLNKENSVFQDTITRNLPYCNEIWILTNSDYEQIVVGQMMQFQGVNYRLFLEEEGKGTATALALISGEMEAEEDYLILPSDLFLSGEGYADAIYKAKELAKEGQICLFGTTPESPSNSFGYIRREGNKVTRFVEKPSHQLAERLFGEDDILWNTGIILVKGRVMQQELALWARDLMALVGNIIPVSKDRSLIFPAMQMEDLPEAGFDKLVLEQSQEVSVVQMPCRWNDVSDYEAYECLVGNDYEGVLQNQCDHTSVINENPGQVVVTNHLQDLLVVNTPDAIYVSSREDADEIKSIIAEHTEDFGNYFDYNPRSYRSWGIREVIRKEAGFRVRKITIYAGKTLSKHLHWRRNENYSVISGQLSVELEDEIQCVKAGESINILPGRVHRLFNDGDQPVTMIEVDTGGEIDEWDMIHPDDRAEENLPSLYRLAPAYKDYLWGGTLLKDRFKKASPYEITAESWELSAHPDGPSTVVGGPFDGMDFASLVKEHGRSLCGWKSTVFDRFPILIKFIDARNKLSVQIHPNDDYAFVNEGEFGKNEMWLVLDCQPGASLYCGLARAAEPEEIERRAKDGTIMELLNEIKVKPGDVIYVPAGTIHAIGAGILVCEVQQNSNSTYRLFDYDRVGKDGRKRPLHLKKAMDVVNTRPYVVHTEGFDSPKVGEHSTMQVIARNKYFQATRYSIAEEETIPMDQASFLSLIVLEGSCLISCGEEELSAKAGESIFVSAGRKVVRIKGNCNILATNI